MTHFKPIQGDPAAVNVHADQMTAAADKMTQAASVLRELGKDGSYRSKAISKFRTQASQLADVMTHASVRYRHAGHALDRYWPVLRDAQETAGKAISSANATDVGSAHNHYLALKARQTGEYLNPLNDPAEERRHQIELDQAEVAFHEQQTRYATAKQHYDEAVARLDRAAQTAIAEIDEGERYSHLNDTLYDDLKGFKEEYIDPVLDKVVEVVSKVLREVLPKLIEFIDALAELASLIAMVLTVIAAVLAVVSLIPGVGVVTGPLAGAVFLVARGFSLAAAALKGLKALAVGIQFLMGDATYGELMSAGIAVATTLVLSKVAGGGKITNALKASGLEGQLARAAGEAGAEIIGHEIGTTMDRGGETAETIWDRKWDGAPEFWESATDASLPGQLMNAIDDNATVDVSDMSTDFSGIDTDRIIDQAFGSDTVENRGLVTTSVCAEAA
jgi:hypothetical protein